MRNHLLAAGIAAAALIPGLAMAQTSCEQQHQHRVNGTIAGAGVGALLGGLIAGRHDRVAGAAIGGVGGAVVGNQMSKPDADCAHAYGYYDGQGAWHANAVDRQAARGYYARDGAWVDGAPNGYYDNGGRWIAASSAGTGGYYTSSGHWAPTTAQGYYETDGRWTPPAADAYRSNATYRDRDGDRRDDDRRDNDRRDNGRQDLGEREAVIGQMIQAGLGDGRLTRWQGSRANNTLNDIRRQQARMSRREGQLNGREEASLQARLDTLSDSLRTQEMQNSRRYY